MTITCVLLKGTVETRECCLCLMQGFDQFETPSCAGPSKQIQAHDNCLFSWSCTRSMGCRGLGPPCPSAAGPQEMPSAVSVRWHQGSSGSGELPALPRDLPSAASPLLAAKSQLKPKIELCCSKPSIS